MFVSTASVEDAKEGAKRCDALLDALAWLPSAESWTREDILSRLVVPTVANQNLQIGLVILKAMVGVDEAQLIKEARAIMAPVMKQRRQLEDAMLTRDEITAASLAPTTV